MTMSKLIGGFQMKTLFFSRMSLLCGSMLAFLGLISLLTVPFLDIDRSSRYPATLSVLTSSGSVPPQPVFGVGLSSLPDFVRVSRDKIWTSKLAEFYYGCSSPTKFLSRHDFVSNGYIMIQTSGGLNQQRTGITDAVVVARILNATMVIPKLDHKSFWKDSSNFSDIFDVDWFIKSLASDVVIVKELPANVKIPGGKLISMRVPRKCTPHYYLTRILPILKRKKVIRLSKFDYRLANKLDTNLQKLRCRVNYHALRFTRNIRSIGESLGRRLKQKSGRYIALHLRFEPDMLAFSGCDYGGGEKERKELGIIRKRWKTLHQKNPEKERRHGRCPLTPEEVGLMLQALGFGSDCYLYVASGEVYGGDQTLAPLKALFPNFYTKDLLASKEELEPFSSHSSQMAAIDFIVCDESDVFVTNNNGNMARILAGRRRYYGHKRTIRPNARKLGNIFLSRMNMTWNMFALRVRTVQRGFMGEPEELRPGRGQFFENPSSCICENPKLKGKLQVLKYEQNKTRNKKGLENSVDQIADLQSNDEVEEEDDDDENIDRENDIENENFLIQQTDLEKEDKTLTNIEDPEEEMPWLSD